MKGYMQQLLGKTSISAVLTPAPWNHMLCPHGWWHRGLLSQVIQRAGQKSGSSACVLGQQNLTGKMEKHKIKQ